MKDIKETNPLVTHTGKYDFDLQRFSIFLTCFKSVEKKSNSDIVLKEISLWFVKRGLQLNYNI